MRVDNAAAIGYTSWHGRKVLERDTAPVDVVAIRFAWNDGSAGDVRPYDKRWRRWLCCSAVGRNVLLALESDANADRMKLGPALSVEEFKACLRSLVSAARARDALPILIDYPISTAPLRPDTEIGLKVTHPWSNAPDEVFAHHARYREAIAAVARETGAAFVAPDMDDSCFSPLDVVHPNLEGARRTAEAVARVIEARWKPNRP
jgi:lysophospholipase L1-like esterase